MTVGLLALIIILIFFKNNVMKKTKKGAINNIWIAATVYSQSNATWLLRIRNSRDANI